jgi:hypothetical protein
MHAELVFGDAPCRKKDVRMLPFVLCYAVRGMYPGSHPRTAARRKRRSEVRQGEKRGDVEIGNREERAESREQRAESREQRAESRKQISESRDQRAEENLVAREKEVASRLVRGV